MTQTRLGAKVADTATTPQFAVGARTTRTGKDYVYVQATSALAANQAAFVDEDFTAVPVTTTNGTYGGVVGVPEVAIAASSYGWVQTYGNCNVNVAASCAADVRLNTTATAGRIDDDGTTGAKVINGVKLNTARAASAGDAPAFLNFPTVGATL